MAETYVSYKEKLYNTVKWTYKDDANLEKYLKFRVEYEVKKVKSFGATYDHKSKTIRVLLNNENYEDLLLAVLIHEVTHHIQYQKYDHTDHSYQFRQIQKELLYTAMDNHYINPFKLKAYYLYLSNYSEMNKIVKMIDEYIEDNNISQDIHFIGYCELPYSEELVEYLKEKGYRFYKGNRNTKNMWWKFSDKYIEGNPSKTGCKKTVRV